MKKLLSLMMCGMLLFGCSDEYDDSALRSDLNDLESRVAKLEQLCKQMNSDISSLQTVVTALQNNDYVTGVALITDKGQTIGYTISFAKAQPITIYNGKDGQDGTDGKDSGYVPTIGVKRDADGIYYWTIDGSWLTDEQGDKIKAQGTDGAKGDTGDKGDTGNTGAQGETGVTPQLKIEDGWWFVSYDEGKSWTQLGKAAGEDGKDGANGIFKTVTEDDENVYFTLTDDTVITIPKGDNSSFAIAFDTTDIAILNGGGTKTISYTLAGATEHAVVKTVVQDGWKATVNAASANKGTITVTAPDPIVESEILVFANDGSYRTVMAALNCSQGQLTIADKAVDVAISGGTQTVKLTTNLDYTVHIPETAQSWLSVVETRAMREDAIVFDVAENEGIQRFATVALKDEQGGTLQTIIIRQNGTCSEVHVATKGELETVLANYDYANIESLKITGVLNDVDFLFIYRMMPKLKNLDIAEVEITALPKQAFYNSKNVENLVLPNTLVTIGEEMFYNSCLKTVKIPANVETIETSAFKDCKSLATVTFEPGSHLKTIRGGYDNYHDDYYGAFADCTALISIEIPASVETIEASAFKNCTWLGTVTFEQGSHLKTIGGGHSNYGYYYGAFAYCTALTSIEIPASVETIEASAFQNCTSLATVTFEQGSCLKTIGGGYEKDYGYYYGVFADCTALTSIEIPASVETIEASAFKNCTSLATVTFEQGSCLKTIGGGYSNYGYYYGAFVGCGKLMTVDMSECTQVQSIGSGAFYQDSELRLFKIGTATPPKCESDSGRGGNLAFKGINPYSVLKVPSGCAEAYKRAYEWSRFASITGLDE